MTVEIAPMFVSTTMRDVTVQAFAISSMTSTASRKDRPCPPSAVGTVMPQKPACARAFTMSQGYSSSRSMAAARGHATSAANARARAWSSISSCERPSSIAATIDRTDAKGGYRFSKDLRDAATLQVNHSLGLTFYCSGMPSRTHSGHLLASAAVAAILAISAGGCSNIATRETTGSVAAASSTPATQDEWRRSLETWGTRYRANPNDADAAIAYARALRATDQRAQA